MTIVSVIKIALAPVTACFSVRGEFVGRVAANFCHIPGLQTVRPSGWTTKVVAEASNSVFHNSSPQNWTTASEKLESQG